MVCCLACWLLVGGGCAALIMEPKCEVILIILVRTRKEEGGRLLWRCCLAQKTLVEDYSALRFTPEDEGQSTKDDSSS